MRIGLIRHGETDWNAAARLQGTTDIPLNERGIEQAKDAARLLIGHNWMKVYSSPLGRTRHTARTISDALGLPEATIAPGLLERSFGELEGESVYRPDGTRLPLDHPTIEPAEAVVSRAMDALITIAKENPATDVLAITHGSVVRLTLQHLLGTRAPHISNLGYSVIETDASAPEGFVVRIANGYPVTDLHHVWPQRTSQASV